MDLMTCFANLSFFVNKSFVRGSSFSERSVSAKISAMVFLRSPLQRLSFTCGFWLTWS